MHISSEVQIIFASSCFAYCYIGCPQQPGKPHSDVSGKFAVVRWQKATVLPGDPPVTLYIVQAKELSTSMSCSPSVFFRSACNQEVRESDSGD